MRNTIAAKHARAKKTLICSQVMVLLYEMLEGRSPHWIKIKNPKAPAVKREAKEDWEK
jgi:hypothetical protein